MVYPTGGRCACRDGWLLISLSCWRFYFYRLYAGAARASSSTMVLAPVLVVGPGVGRAIFHREMDVEIMKEAFRNN